MRVIKTFDVSRETAQHMKLFLENSHYRFRSALFSDILEMYVHGKIELKPRRVDNDTVVVSVSIDKQLVDLAVKRKETDIVPSWQYVIEQGFEQIYLS